MAFFYLPTEVCLMYQTIVDLSFTHKGRYMFKTLGLSFMLSFSGVVAAQSLEQAQQKSISSYSNLVYSTYSDALKKAIILKADINAFVATPSVTTMEIAKNSWKMARAPYGQSEVFRFYNGPIDRDGGPEGLLNAWPLDEAYIDYVIGAPQAGIINNLTEFPEISKELLESLNELDGEKNVSTGYHAIEFLLWGQDTYVDGAGRRSYEDYVLGRGLNANRRAAYLLAATDLLVEHLQGLVNEWAPNADNFRRGFETQKQTATLKNILSGVVYMAGDELSGERMYVAYDTMAQEDEHSCFSDMTHMDVQWNFWGVENVLKSTKLLELAPLKNTELAKSITARMAKVRGMLAAIPAPFDQAILSETARPNILASIEEMEALATDIAKASEVLGAKVDF